MEYITTTSDTDLTISLELCARENMKLFHFSLRYIPYLLKTNKYPLFILHRHIFLEFSEMHLGTSVINAAQGVSSRILEDF